MAPTTTTKRKPPMFKPPRPVNSGTSSGTASKKAKPGVQTKGKAAAKTSGPRGGFQPATTVISSDTEPQDEDDVEDDEDEEEVEASGEDQEMDDADGRESSPDLPSAGTFQEEAKPAIPSKLLARLLYEGFEDKDMRIGKEAMNVVGKYMETFVREAIARAGHERKENEGNGGISDGFLQVEDLEKLAPQLLLDF